MRYRHILFDFDGTLADSLLASVAIFAELAPRFGLKPVVDLEAARRTPLRQLLKQLGVSFWTLPRLVRAFQDAAGERAHELRLFPGWPPVLAELSARGHRLGVVSSNREANIRTCLRANGVENHFATVNGMRSLFGKAKVLRRVMRAERATPDDVLYVGDELRDIEAAKRAKVASAAVTWGFHAEELLAAAGPTVVVREPGELLRIAAG